MPDSRSRRIGCVKYLNARPLIHGWRGEVTFDHPAALTTQLQRGVFQIALVSSFEFLRNPIYRIVDDVSISCDGPVHSVVVAHQGEISEIEEIALDPASLTSVALLRVLLAQLGRQPRLFDASSKDPDPRSGRLLIGDQAIRFRKEHAQDFEFWDLGEMWKKLTGLPFVFALWLVRREAPQAEVIADKLRELRNRNLRNLDSLITEEKEFDHEFCKHYFLDHLRFSFGEKEKQGLQTFAESCAKHDLIPKRELALNLI